MLYLTLFLSTIYPQRHSVYDDLIQLLLQQKASSLEHTLLILEEYDAVANIRRVFPMPMYSLINLEYTSLALSTVRFLSQYSNFINEFAVINEFHKFISWF